MTGAAYAVNMDDLVIYVCTNADDGDDTQQTTNVAITSIIPGKMKILGYEVATYNTSKNSECYAALYDQTAANVPTTYLFHEIEAASAVLYAEKVFIGGKYLSRGLTIIQGANTTVVIYAERYLP